MTKKKKNLNSRNQILAIMSLLRILKNMQDLKFLFAW